jgi:WD40 repeat protein
MASGSADRFSRYLIATGVTNGLTDSQQTLIDSFHQVVDLMTGTFGYQRLTGLGLDPTADQVRQDLRNACQNVDEDDVVVFFHTGHADLTGDLHRLWMGDTVDRFTRTLATAELAELMLAETPLSHALIILDTCFAGRGGAEAMISAMRSGASMESKTLTVITSAHPEQEVRAGDFARLLKEAIEDTRTAGSEPDYLTPGGIVAHVNGNSGRPAWQTVSASVLFQRSSTLPYFPNPRRTAGSAYDIDEQAENRARHRVSRDRELRDHFMAKATGLGEVGDSWRFVGRHQALRTLSRWLADRENAARSCVVVGDPGSGKSAVLGRLAVLSNPHWRPSVPLGTAPSDTLPPARSVDVSIHAHGKPTAEVLDALCAAAAVTADASSAAFLDAVRDRDFVALIDAVDEAERPIELTDKLLRPLIDADSRGRCRLLLGSRRHLVEEFGPKIMVVDLDAEQYADPAALREYIRVCLMQTGTNSIYRNLPATHIQQVVDVVADAAGKSYLVGQITARRLAEQLSLPDVSDLAWRGSLPATASDAMRDDLRNKFGSSVGRAIDLLRPLAYAFGAGLPWEDIWAPLASALSGRSYRDEDLVWLHSFGSYAVETAEFSRSVYRLFHESLADFLREGMDSQHIHEIFVAVLLRNTPTTSDGHRDWRQAHPYVREYLAVHARHAGSDCLDRLLADVGFLLNAAQPGLIPGLPRVVSRRARRTAMVYERASHHLRTRPENERVAYLELAARRAGHSALADEAAGHPVRHPWTVPFARWRPESSHYVLSGHVGWVLSVACVTLPDGHVWAVTGGQDGTVRTWDLMSGSAVGEPLLGHQGPVRSIACARLPDGRLAAVSGGDDHAVRVWDLNSHSPMTESLLGHQGAVRSLACSYLPDGRAVVVSGSDDRTVRVCDMQTGRPIYALKLAAGGRIHSVACAQLPAGQTVVLAGSDDRTISSWDLISGKQLTNSWSGHDDWVCSICCMRSSGGRLIAVTASGDGTLRSWDVAASKPIGTPLTGHLGWVRGVATAKLANGSAVVVSVGDDHSVRVWDPEAHTAVAGPLIGHAGPVNGVACAHLPDRRMVAVTVSDDGTLRLWDLERSGAVRQATKTFTAIRGVACTDLPGGRSVAVTCGESNTATVFGLNSGRRLDVDLTSNSGWVTAVTFGRLSNGTVVVVGGSSDDTVTVWNAVTGRPVERPPVGHSGPIRALTSLQLGKSECILVSGSDDHTARVWRIGGQDSTVTELAGHTDRVRDVALCQLPEGRLAVLTASDDHAAYVWDPFAQRIIARMIGHTGPVRAIAAVQSFDGRIAALTGSDDGSVRVWDLGTGEQIGEPLVGHVGPISAVEWVRLADGICVAVSGGEDHTIRAWRSVESGFTDIVIDLEVPIWSLAAHKSGAILAGTEHGLIMVKLGWRGQKWSRTALT